MAEICLRSKELNLLMCRDVQVLNAAGKHQILVFVHSRKETAKTARYLKEEALKDDKLAQFMKVCWTAWASVSRRMAHIPA